MNFIFLAFPVLPSLGMDCSSRFALACSSRFGMPEFPSISPTPSHQPGLHLPHPHRSSSSFRAPPFCSSTHLLLTCQTFPVFDQRIALECVSRHFVPRSASCLIFKNVLMSNDQYRSTSSLPKDHLSRTTDINSTATRSFFTFSKTGANRLIPRPRASSPLPNK